MPMTILCGKGHHHLTREETKAEIKELAHGGSEIPVSREEFGKLVSGVVSV